MFEFRHPTEHELDIIYRTVERQLRHVWLRHSARDILVNCQMYNDMWTSVALKYGPMVVMGCAKRAKGDKNNPKVGVDIALGRASRLLGTALAGKAISYVIH